MFGCFSFPLKYESRLLSHRLLFSCFSVHFWMLSFGFVHLLFLFSWTTKDGWINDNNGNRVNSNTLTLNKCIVLIWANSPEKRTDTCILVSRKCSAKCVKNVPIQSIPKSVRIQASRTVRAK